MPRLASAFTVGSGPQEYRDAWGVTASRSNVLIRYGRATAAGPMRSIPSTWPEYRGSGEQVREQLAAEFSELADRWERETANFSSVTQIVMNGAYQQIVGIGRAVLPLVLARMNAAPAFWFPALHAITRENPVLPEHRGDLLAMTKDWLNWGRLHGYL